MKLTVVTIINGGLETPMKSIANNLEEINIVVRMETEKNESITKISCNNEDSRKI